MVQVLTREHIIPSSRSMEQTAPGDQETIMLSYHPIFIWVKTYLISRNKAIGIWTCDKK